MTRATQKPVRRIVRQGLDDYVVEVSSEGLMMRPKRARRPTAVVRIGWGQLYTRLLLQRPKKITRGLLTLGR